MQKYNIIDRAKYTYFQIPKILVFGEKYKKSLTAVDRNAYAVLLDRLNVSIKNNWVDENGNIYFVYTNEQLMDTLSVSKPTLMKIKKRLRETNLLVEEKTGRANRLYLLEPVVSNIDEAKYILDTEKTEIADKSKISEEERQKRSNRMKGKNNPRTKLKNLTTSDSSTHEVKKFNFRGKENEPQRLSSLPPSKNNLVRTNKDIKDSKDNKDWKAQNDLLTSGINKNNQDIESSKEMINEFIENKNMEVVFGKPIIQNFLKYSKYDFLTFKTFYDKLFFAHKAIEDELGVSIMLNEPITAYSEKHQLELSKAFWRAIQRYKENKIEKDFNNYLFGVFKGTLEEIAKDIKNEGEMYKRKQERKEGAANHDYEDVPMINWLEEI